MTSAPATDRPQSRPKAISSRISPLPRVETIGVYGFHPATANSISLQSHLDDPAWFSLPVVELWSGPAASGSAGVRDDFHFDRDGRIPNLSRCCGMTSSGLTSM